jgi:hypothetical protein
LKFVGDGLEIRDFSASLFSGVLTGEADVSLARGGTIYKGKAKLTDADCSSLDKLYFGADLARGRLNAQAEFAGRGEDARLVTGHGEASLTGGNLDAIPFLSPFTAILEGVAPGLSRDAGREATATFRLADGAITTDDLHVQANGFAMLGSGRLSFLEDRIDFGTRIAAEGLPSLILSPVSRLLDYAAVGKLSQPQWRLRLVPGIN